MKECKHEAVTVEVMLASRVVFVCYFARASQMHAKLRGRRPRQSRPAKGFCCFGVARPAQLCQVMERLSPPAVAPWAAQAPRSLWSWHCLSPPGIATRPAAPRLNGTTSHPACYLRLQAIKRRLCATPLPERHFSNVDDALVEALCICPKGTLILRMLARHADPRSHQLHSPTKSTTSTI